MKEYRCEFFSIEANPRLDNQKPHVILRLVADEEQVAHVFKMVSGAELAIIISELIRAGDQVFRGDGSYIKVMDQPAEGERIEDAERKLLEGPSP